MVLAIDMYTQDPANGAKKNYFYQFTGVQNVCYDANEVSKPKE